MLAGCRGAKTNIYFHCRVDSYEVTTFSVLAGCCGATTSIVSAPFRLVSDDPLGVGGVVAPRQIYTFIAESIHKGRPSWCWRGVVALKLVVSAPFRFGSDDLLGVCGVSWREN